MNKTLRISFSLKNTYRVNTILYSLKQIPLIKRILPDMLYRSEELKLFANVVSVLWEIVSVFLGKVLYLLIMVCGAGILYGNLPGSNVFLHILLFLTIIGSFANTTLFNPSKDKYYAIILMRMNARDYTLVNYTYAMLKVVVVPAIYHIIWNASGSASFAVSSSALFHCGMQIYSCGAVFKGL